MDVEEGLGAAKGYKPEDFFPRHPAEAWRLLEGMCES